MMRGENAIRLNGRDKVKNVTWGNAVSVKESEMVEESAEGGEGKQVIVGESDSSLKWPLKWLVEENDDGRKWWLQEMWKHNMNRCVMNEKGME